MIDWSKAPEGATHVYDREDSRSSVIWYRECENGKFEYWTDHCWYVSNHSDTWFDTDLTPRPTAPKPYTRDEALQFLVDRLDTWPTDIADAPLCPGWGWEYNAVFTILFTRDKTGVNQDFEITARDWHSRHPTFQPFTSIEDAQPVTTGQKFDSGKPIIGAIPPHAELAVARVMTFGAQKYARDNWRKIDDIPTRYMDAALRHLNAVRRGETVDPESGEHHLAHAACCILFMLDIEESK